jgi:hypothetical protein
MELSQQRHRGHVRRCGHTANESLDDNDGMRRVPCTSTRCRASRTRHCSRNFDAVSCTITGSPTLTVLKYHSASSVLSPTQQWLTFSYPGDFVRGPEHWTQCGDRNRRVHRNRRRVGCAGHGCVDESDAFACAGRRRGAAEHVLDLPGRTNDRRDHRGWV